MADAVPPLSITVAGTAADVAAVVEALKGLAPGYADVADLERARAAHCGGVNDGALVVVQFRRISYDARMTGALDVDALEYILYDGAIQLLNDSVEGKRKWLRSQAPQRAKQERLF